MPLTALGLEAVAGNATVAANATVAGNAAVAAKAPVLGIVGRAAADVVGAIEVFFGFLLGPDQKRKYIWDDPKFTGGIMLWAYVWWVWLSERAEQHHRARRAFHWTALMVLGLNLAALSMLQMLGPAGFFGLLAMTYANIELTKRLFPGRQAFGESFEARDVYEDLSCPFMQVTTIFLGQSILVLFLIYSVYHNYAQNEADAVYTFWVAAYVSVQMSGFFKRGRDGQLGTPCDVEWWRALLETSRTSMFKIGDGDWFGLTFREMKARAFMSFAVNTFYRDIIAFITPVLCMQSSDGVDFVQNCFALGYITTLDDVGEGKRFEIQRREANDRFGGAQEPLLEDARA